MSKHKHKQNKINMSDVLQKMASGELLICGGSMFTDEENDRLLKNAVEHCLNKK